MIDLARYEGTGQYDELVTEIRKLREVSARFAEASEFMAADADPIRRDCVPCGQLCREKAKAALEAYRAL